MEKECKCYTEIQMKNNEGVLDVNKNLTVILKNHDCVKDKDRNDVCKKCGLIISTCKTNTLDKCGETHSCCNKRLKEEGSKARCCYCEPHKGCELVKPEGVGERWTKRKADVMVAILERKSFGGAVEMLEKLMQDYADNLFLQEKAKWLDERIKDEVKETERIEGNYKKELKEDLLGLIELSGYRYNDNEKNKVHLEALKSALKLLN